MTDFLVLAAFPVLAVFIAVGVGLHWTILAFPVVLFVGFLLILGFGFLLCAANVWVRDVRHLVVTLMALGFYVTPMFYGRSNVPVQYRWVQSLNPMTYILEAHRAVLIEGDLPELGFYVVRSLRSGSSRWVRSCTTISAGPSSTSCERDRGPRRGQALPAAAGRCPAAAPLPPPSRAPEQTWALRGVSLEVATGETVGLVGGNGSGKSTLLRIISGITRPTTGSARTSGQVRGLLTLGDTTELLMSGEENAITAGIVAGLTRQQAEARLGRIAAFAELEEHMDQPLRTYSDGMRTRLAFAVAVNIDPSILLIDEILAVGDLRFQEASPQPDQGSWRDNRVTILRRITCGIARAPRICPRTVWLQNGLVGLDGDTEQVIDSYQNMMRLDLPAPEERVLGGLRTGTRRVEIVDARLLSREGTSTARIAVGSPVVVEIDYPVCE